VAVGHGGDECRIPDVVVTRAATIDAAARLIASVQHYLVIEQDRRRVVYHGRRPSGGLEPRILRAGEIALDPPRVRLGLDALYRDTELAAP
jgi:hypothetical protein